MYLSSRTRGEQGRNLPNQDGRVDGPGDRPGDRPGDGPDGKVGRNVVFLGLTSMFTDVSAEMVTAILPLYLTLGLGLGPLGFGAFDGFYQAVTAVLPLAGGLAADRWRRHKEVATAGYGLSAGCKLGLAAVVGSTGPTIALLAVDRVGKGIRTSPRDALISLSSSPTRLAESFGVHRAFDTTGALIGPVVAFGILYLVPGGYDAVFVSSFCVALIGLGVMGLFVQSPLARPTVTARPAVRAVTAGAPLGRPVTTDDQALDEVRATPRAAGWPASALLSLWRTPGFRPLVLVGSVLGLVTLSDAFVYLTFQQRSTLSTEVFPLLYVGSALVYLLLAVPMGRLADRTGRVRVLVLGHIPLVLAYLVLLYEGPRTPRLVALVALVGVHYACTSGVLMAVAGSMVPAELRTFGMALLASAVAVSRAASSLGFGAFWSWWGSHAAIVVYVAGLAVAVPVAARLLRRCDMAR